jgi:N-acyl-D-glutamate deacylase/N-acyl-D-amino-acid deacylase
MDYIAKHQDVCCDCYPYSASSSTLDLKQVTSDFDIFITWSDPRPDLAGRMLKDIASELDLSLMDAATALQPAGAVYHCMDEDDVERVLKYRLSMVGSDGLPNDPHPHPRLWGTFPKVLGHYSRERQLFSLSTAVHKMTGMSAKRFELSQRGEIKEGNFADLVLFDPSQIKDEATFENPVAAARGIHLVMVNGKSSYQNGQVATTRHGRMLYRNK